MYNPMSSAPKYRDIGTTGGTETTDTQNPHANEEGKEQHNANKGYLNCIASTTLKNLAFSDHLRYNIFSY